MNAHSDHVLSSPALGGIEATYVPSAGMVCRSLTVTGEELLGQRGGLEKYVSEHGTMGIPLLHPWANRVAVERFEVAGRQVDLTLARKDEATDPNRLLIHGLLAGHPAWEGVAAEPDRLTARFDWASQEELIGAFPFAHALEMDVTLADAKLSGTTTLRAPGDTGVPVAFGYLPYFTLPGVPRADWEVELPVTE